MAFVPVVPVSLNMTIQQGQSQQFIFPPINDPSGSPVDLSSWSSIKCTAVPASPTPVGADVDFGTSSGASNGVITTDTTSSDFSGKQAGIAKLLLQGKATSGDPYQYLGTGVVTIAAN